MPIRIAGKLLKENKRAQFALTDIYGVGVSLARKILRECGADPLQKLKDIPEKTMLAVREKVERGIVVEGDLKRQIIAHIQRLKQIKSYRGMRHTRGLPARGQRTKTNSRTVRGNVRKTMGSGRKPAPSPT